MKYFIVGFVTCFALTVHVDGLECGVMPMTQWAGEASLRKKVLPNPVGLVVIQHTVTPEPSTDGSCEYTLQAIRKYQRETLGFDDIAESFLICGNGKVYEGAGWGLVGAHTKNFNVRSIGISFIGEFGSHLPSAEALAAARQLIACGVSGSHVAGEYKLVGHRQVSSTVSPGDALQKEIESWPHWQQTV